MDNKNTILAIVLSAVVLIAWQYFVGMPQLEKERQQQQQAQQQAAAKKAGQPSPPTAAPGAAPTAPGAAPPSPAAPGQPAAPASAPPAPPAPGESGHLTPAQAAARDAALKQSPRVQIETPSLRGSIDLKGGRIDDLSLVKFRETVDPKSPPIVLLSPSGSPDPFYAEFGWSGTAGHKLKLPTADTVWKQSGSGALSVGHPVTLTYDNGEGLEFRRTIAVDDKYLFTIKDEVTNKSANPVTLYPYGLISRHGTPPTLGYYILHEGLIGVLGNDGLQEITYKKIEDKKVMNFDVTNGWLGITDKYWAATLLPDTDAHLKARFSTGKLGEQPTYQTDYLLDARTIAPGASTTADARLFAGAKEVHVVNDYEKQLNLNRFDLLIDWGWFYFITKPLFTVIDWFYRLVGNFGIAILIVTVLIKVAFFPLANKSYASMAKMKAVQPQMTALRERYGDDKAKQQQELMALYKKEKINPLAGCLPVVIQIPVFFSLYKVLFVTIEMRHAPFFGWIHDLSAPDPTNVFTLFGLIPFDPTMVPVVGHFLHLGLWPLIMGVTMWAQMKLNPAPPDPTQAMIFNWMPVIFTFMLASFPAGLVIYWAWNNSLSVAQQSVIMRKHGAKIELFDNVKALFGKKKAQS
jgi:YidC/Oxa1 family membrane protein insertase